MSINRRSFIKRLGLSGLAAALTSSVTIKSEPEKKILGGIVKGPAPKDFTPIYPHPERISVGVPNGRYTFKAGEHLNLGDLITIDSQGRAIAVKAKEDPVFGIAVGISNDLTGQAHTCEVIAAYA